MNEPTFNPRAGIEVAALYGFDARRGLVVLRVSDGDGNAVETFHTPAKAREIAAFLLESASAAEGDETVVLALQENGVPLPQIGGFLQALREKRALIEQRGRREARDAVAFDQSSPDTEDRADPDA